MDWKKQRENCKSKGAYDKRGAVTVVNASWKKEHIKLRAYPCPCCPNWHVSKKR